MPLSPDVCYRAVVDRDPRYDGRFFTGVHTTGIYCRPVCPARTPLRKNVSFYEHAAAAEAAGFRPCKRCRPDAAPGSPAWCGTSAIVARALRLIDREGLENGSLDAFATRLGIGSRQLRRLFGEHVGAGPKAIAETRRLHFARTLVDQTDLALSVVASSAGYGSIRRFNASFRRTYGCAPSSIRRRPRTLRNGVATDGEPALSLSLATGTPYGLDAALAYLAPRVVDPFERVQGDRFVRHVPEGVLEVRPGAKRAELQIVATLGDVSKLLPYSTRIRQMFDVSGASPAAHRQLRCDPMLSARMTRGRTLRMIGAWDGFELALRAVLGQQVTVAAATTLTERLFSLAATPRGSTRTPLSPRDVADAPLERLGIPKTRARALKELANAVGAGRLRLDGIGDAGEARARLLAIPGIGPWTVEYIAMRALFDPDAFPASDLGLRRAAGNGTPLSTRALAARAEAWRPYRAYAAMLLWNGPTHATKQGRRR